jgi:hypothetical protein
MKEHYGISVPLHSPRTITEKHAKKIHEIECLENVLPKQGKEYIIA